MVLISTGSSGIQQNNITQKDTYNACSTRGSARIPLFPSSAPSSRTFSQIPKTLKTRGSANNPVLIRIFHMALFSIQPNNTRKYSRKLLAVMTPP
ncbi:hypothetical protein D3C72_1854570 [compost metagenome]